MNISLKVVLALIILLTGFFALSPRVIFAQIKNPVGGKFLPGLVDIYTPDPFCGLLVSVIGPRPGVFTFAPVRIYNYFPQAPWHVGLNMLGLSGPPLGVCPPPLFMFGSGLTPGF